MMQINIDVIINIDVNQIFIVNCCNKILILFKFLRSSLLFDLKIKNNMFNNIIKKIDSK